MTEERLKEIELQWEYEQFEDMQGIVGELLIALREAQQAIPTDTTLKWDTVFGLLIHSLFHESTGTTESLDCIDVIKANCPASMFREWYKAQGFCFEADGYTRKYILSKLLDEDTNDINTPKT